MFWVHEHMYKVKGETTLEFYNTNANTHNNTLTTLIARCFMVKELWTQKNHQINDQNHVKMCFP